MFTLASWIGVLQRWPHAGLRGQVHHDLGPVSVEDIEETFRPNVQLREGERLPVSERVRQVLPPPRGQVVDGHHGATFREESIAE